MEYRKIAGPGKDISIVSLGTEYLLSTSYQETEATVCAALDAGVTYFDLFYAQTEFQERMGRILEPYRDKVMLAAHYGAGEKNGQYQRTRDPGRCEAYFEAFLRNYRTDHVDVLFCHNYDKREDVEALFASGGLCDRIHEHKNAGRALIVGFSGHTPETAMTAVRSGRIDLLMYPVNVTTHGNDDARKLYELCEHTGVAVVAMKPYAGGKLVERDMSASYEERVSTNHGSARGPAVRCLAYALSRPGVIAAVPGCSNVEHVNDALSFMAASDEERDFSRLLSEHSETSSGSCTYCNHCLPCPVGIDVGSVLRFYDTHRGDLTGAPHDVVRCTLCGTCTKRCPFGVDVVPRIVEMQEAVAE